jgi:D-glycerate 3-kinase
MTSIPAAQGATTTTIVDDKSMICIPFILNLLQQHRAQHGDERPFIIGLNGVQGVGKTTLVKVLSSTLAAEGLVPAVVSLDDFYLTHEDQVALAASQPGNQLVSCRGEPGKI